MGRLLNELRNKSELKEARSNVLSAIADLSIIVDEDNVAFLKNAFAVLNVYNELLKEIEDEAE